MNVWNCGKHIIYCDKQRSGRVESKVNIISSDIILVATCTADTQVSEEVVVYAHAIGELLLYSLYLTMAFSKVLHRYPYRTRFPSPSRVLAVSYVVMPTCQAITQALPPPILPGHSRDLLHWVTQESEAATRPTMICNNPIAKHTAMTSSGHAKEFSCVDPALPLHRLETTWVYSRYFTPAFAGMSLARCEVARGRWSVRYLCYRLTGLDVDPATHLPCWR